MVQGATGVGLEIAYALAERAAEIVLIDDDPIVGMVASQIRSRTGIPAMGARGDVSDPAFVNTAFRAAVEHLDFPDIVVFAGRGDAVLVQEAFTERLRAAGKSGVMVVVVETPSADPIGDLWVFRIEVSSREPHVVEGVVSLCEVVLAKR